MTTLSEEIARRIEAELQYPGPDQGRGDSRDAGGGLCPLSARDEREHHRRGGARARRSAPTSRPRSRSSRRAASRRASPWSSSATIPASAVTCGRRARRAMRPGCTARPSGSRRRPPQAELLGDRRPAERRSGDPRHSRADAAAEAHRPRDRSSAASIRDKDVDGFHPVNVGKLLIGDRMASRPCTPAGVQQMLVRLRRRDEGRRMRHRRAQQHRRQADGRAADADGPGRRRDGHRLPQPHARSCRRTRRADILIAAVGKPEMITGDMVKPGRGRDRRRHQPGYDSSQPKGYRLVGDVDFAPSRARILITPVPGGVGPMTIADAAAEYPAGLAPDRISIARV